MKKKSELSLAIQASLRDDEISLLWDQDSPDRGIVVRFGSPALATKSVANLHKIKKLTLSYGFPLQFRKKLKAVRLSDMGAIISPTGRYYLVSWGDSWRALLEVHVDPMRVKHLPSILKEDR